MNTDYEYDNDQTQPCLDTTNTTQLQYNRNNGLVFAFAMAFDCCCNTHPTKIILAGEFLVVHDNMVIICCGD